MNNATKQPDSMEADHCILAATSELMELKPLATNSQHKPTHKVNRFDLTHDYNLMLTTAQKLQGQVNHWYAAATNSSETVANMWKKNADTATLMRLEIDQLNQTIASLQKENNKLYTASANQSFTLSFKLIVLGVGLAGGYILRAMIGA